MLMNKNIEVLSPAGSWESLKAAAAAGADAVYFGAGDFNARRNAANFKEEEISEAVAFCHERGIKVHFTFNTLIFDNEISKALRLVDIICKAGVDAVIIQDLGLVRLIKQAAPDLPLHASTQLSAHNLAGVNELANMGFSRVVLARELSLKEIEHIAEHSTVELEVFVHGALCMSVSGQCYMSSFFGGKRSGNRGLCAQPCRLPFAVNNSNYVLSLKDLSLITHISDLSKKGVFSLKIEGRRKRPEYVAAATSLCAKAARGETVSSGELENLQAVFSREGFTQGYYEAKRGRHMFGIRTAEDTAASASAIKKFRGIYENVENPRVKVDFNFKLETGGTELKAIDENGNVTIVNGTKPEKAINRAVDEKTVCEKLAKTGSTPFYTGKIESSLEPGLTLPVAEINRLRRESLNNLLEQRGKPHIIPFNIPQIEFSTEKQNYVEKYRLRFRKPSQIPANMDIEQMEIIYLPVSELAGGLPKTLPEGVKVGAELPRAFFGDENIILSQLKSAAKYGVKDALCGNIGAINLARAADFNIHCDFGLNITNSFAVKNFVQSGAKSCVVSFETPLSRISDMTAHNEVPCGAIVYGRLPLMLVRNCPVKSFSSCRGEGCQIKDRTGCKFPVVCLRGQGELTCSEILNSRPLWLSDVKKDIYSSGIQFAQFYFTTESADEIAGILNAWKQGESYNGEFTRGLYFHTVS